MEPFGLQYFIFLSSYWLSETPKVKISRTTTFCVLYMGVIVASPTLQEECKLRVLDNRGL